MMQKISSHTILLSFLTNSSIFKNCGTVTVNLKNSLQMLKEYALIKGNDYTCKVTPKLFQGVGDNQCHSQNFGAEGTGGHKPFLGAQFLNSLPLYRTNVKLYFKIFHIGEPGAQLCCGGGGTCPLAMLLVIISAFIFSFINKFYYHSFLWILKTTSLDKKSNSRRHPTPTKIHCLNTFLNHLNEINPANVHLRIDLVTFQNTL